MPTTKQYDSLGVKLNVRNIPISVEEFDQNAKRSGACLDEAVNNVVYRSVLEDFRVAFCEAIEAATGIARKTKKVKKGDKEVDVWDQTQGEYLKDIRIAKGWEEDNTELQRIADQVSADPSLQFDASAPVRKPAGPKNLPEAYKTAARRIFANGNSGKWAQTFSLTYTGDEAKDIELLGWAIKKAEDDKRKAAVEQTYV